MLGLLCLCCVEVSCCLCWVGVEDWGWVAALLAAAARERARRVQPAQTPAQELPPKTAASLTLRHTPDLAGHSRQRCRGQAVDLKLAQQAGTPGFAPAWQPALQLAATSSQHSAGAVGVAVLAVVVCGPPVGVCLEPTFTCHLPAVCLLGCAYCELCVACSRVALQLQCAV